jgi:hypothetical protein
VLALEQLRNTQGGQNLIKGGEPAGMVPSEWREISIRHLRRPKNSSAKSTVWQAVQPEAMPRRTEPLQEPT